MADQEPYPTAASVDSAIKSAARSASKDDPSLTVTERIRLEYFRRLLSRVFSEGDESEWVLKGGTGMLARIPSTRATLDIDLYRSGFTLDQALDDLRRLAEVDLRDYFRFVYLEHHESITGDQQPYVDAYRVSFEVYIGAQSKGRINVDLATGAGRTAPVRTAEPANRLALPRLPSHPYRLYPLVDHISDKVCAVMEKHNGRPSSREKDLVDLAVIALTQRIEGPALRHAIETESRRRRMHPLTGFEVPPSWGAAYTKMARRVPYLTEYTAVASAAALVSSFVCPVLTDVSSSLTWNPEDMDWE
jgi:hypothetical protein